MTANEDTLKSKDKLRLFDRHILIYGLIGASGVGIDYGLYTALISFTGIGFRAANLISVTIAIGNNFYWNIRHNFKLKDKPLLRGLLFFTVGFVGLFVSDQLLVALIEFGKVDAVPAKALVIPAVIFLQYILNRTFTFRVLARRVDSTSQRAKKHNGEA